MRVLWFTNTPSLSAEYLNNKSIGGGWIQSLEAKLNKINSIQLGVSFNLNNQDIKPFEKNETKYYPVNVKSAKGKLKKLTSRWTKPIQKENDIQPYLDIIADFQPDIIHIFGTENVFGLIISKIDIPCIIHIQGNLTIYNRKWYSGLSQWDIFKYSKKMDLVKGFGFYHDYIVNQKTAEREKDIFIQCSYFMGRTDWDRRITSILSPDSQYFHCDEMLRQEFYVHKWAPHDKEKEFVIISTIRNNIYKGLETILDCKEILNKAIPGNKIMWKVAGIGENDEITYILEKKFKATFKENDIQLLGPLEETELIEEMLKADLFVHPSHIDNSPNSLCEAMLLGMPVISTFAGGIPSIVEDKKNGLLVQNGDPYALAGTILELMKNRDYANKLGLKASESAQKRHQPEKILHELLHIYQYVINKYQA